MNTPLPPEQFSELDRELAALLERLLGSADPAVAVAAALASRSAREGHACLHLASVADLSVGDEPAALLCPPLPDWRRHLLAATRVVGRPGEVKPLILDAQNRLYLHRFWRCENELAARIRQFAQAPLPTPDPARLRDAFERLFPVTPAAEMDWQQVAAFAATRSGFTVISGGPGTGKTRTVAFVLALLLELAVPRRLRFAVAAPTGKAAARLQTVLRELHGRLPLAPELRAQLPTEVRTIHRLLGAFENGRGFRHGPESPLPVDVLVVDEASMLDLDLMTRLLAATPRDARVILVGDKDQLPSVETGSVLADLCPPEMLNLFTATFAEDFKTATGRSLPADAIVTAATPLAGRLVQLQRNYRFGDRSGIHRLSRAVIAGDVAAVRSVLHDPGGDGSVNGRPLPTPGSLKAVLREPVLRGLAPVFAATSAAEALRALAGFRILCAVREGPFGVETVNRLVTELLREAGLVRGTGEWFRGRQVMVTANDYALRLFNGDLGVAWPVESSRRELAVSFPDDGDAVRDFAPTRLPQHETAFALTVHKSQGSEFDRVLLLLPAPSGTDAAAEAAFWNGPGRLLTRELLYTAITRARQQVEVWSSESVLARTVSRGAERASGLAEQLAAL